MQPFTRKNVTCYILWAAILVMIAAIVGWWIFYSPGHEPIQPKREGSTVLLQHAGPNPARRG
jgi:hypothetical protein